MTKFNKGSEKTPAPIARRGLFKTDSLPIRMTFDDLNEYDRIRRHLKQTVLLERAPQNLIEAIRSRIRG